MITEPLMVEFADFRHAPSVGMPGAIFLITPLIEAGIAPGVRLRMAIEEGKV